MPAEHHHAGAHDRVLQLTDLRKVYGSDVVAVDRVSFHVARNEIAGLLGPNGAGNTTTINMIPGVLEPTAGSIAIDGMDIARDRRRALQRTNFAAVYGALAIAYLIAACVVFTAVYRRAVRVGLIARYSAESLS